MNDRSPASDLSAYRFDAAGDGVGSRASRHLQDAADALNMVLLTLEGSISDSRGEKRQRATRVRDLLVEAVTALSKAHVYVAGVRTYAVPVVMSSLQDVDAELGRLHQLTSQLLWNNHRFLPGRVAATPLSPDDERDLERMVEGLKVQARIERAMRYRWLGGGVALAAFAPALGIGFAAAGIALGAYGVWRLIDEDVEAAAVA